MLGVPFAHLRLSFLPSPGFIVGRVEDNEMPHTRSFSRALCYVEVLGSFAYNLLNVYGCTPQIKFFNYT